MDSSYITALAALGGSIIGGLTSLGASWVSQNAQARTQQLLGDKSRRQEIYKSFIEEASRMYVDALANDKAEVSKLIGLYVLLSRMRVLSSQPVVESADQVIQAIIGTYFEPNRGFGDLREAMQRHKLDPLRHFSEACRDDLMRRDGL